jgi:hypothetical protein
MGLKAGSASWVSQGCLAEIEAQEQITGDVPPFLLASHKGRITWEDRNRILLQSPDISGFSMISKSVECYRTGGIFETVIFCSVMGCLSRKHPGVSRASTV